MPIHFDLTSKTLDLPDVAAQAATDDALLQTLLTGIAPESKNSDLRYNCFQTLQLLAEQNPARLYPCWDDFAAGLVHPNSNRRYICLYLIAALAARDPENRFEPIFDRYFDLLDDPKLPVAAHLAGVAGKIALARPAMRDRIARRLLDLAVSDPGHDTEHRDLVIGRAVESFGLFFADLEDKAAVVRFVQDARDSGSPRTRKCAEKFLKDWGAG